MSQFQDIFRIITFIIPGYIAYKTYRYKYPAKKSSDLDTIIISIAHTVIIHIILNFVGVDLLFSSEKNSVINQAAILMPTAIGYGFILSLFRLFAIKINYFPKDNISTWGVVLKTYEGIWVIVKLKYNKTIYYGWIGSYSNDPDNENHDFFLKDVSLFDNYNKTIRKIDGEGVYLNTRDVSSIEVWSKHS